MTEMEKIIVLSGTLWFSAVAFIIYSWVVQVRQQQVFRFIAKRLISIEKALTTQPSPKTTQPAEDKLPPKEEAPKKTLSINKNDPISKYETVTLPDEININFVDK